MMIVSGQYITHGSQLDERQIKQLLQPKRRLFRQVTVPRECQLVAWDDYRIQVLEMAEKLHEHFTSYDEKLRMMEQEVQEHIADCGECAKPAEDTQSSGESPDEKFYRLITRSVYAIYNHHKGDHVNRFSLQEFELKNSSYRRLLYFKDLRTGHMSPCDISTMLEYEQSPHAEYVIAEYLFDECVIELSACLDLELSEEVRVECGNKLLRLALAARRQLAEVRKAIRDHREFELEVARDAQTKEKRFASQSNALVGDMIAQDTLDKFV